MSTELSQNSTSSFLVDGRNLLASPVENRLHLEGSRTLDVLGAKLLGKATALQLKARLGAVGCTVAIIPPCRIAENLFA